MYNCWVISTNNERIRNDTSEFRGHSTRGASTPKAKARGLSCQEIMNMTKLQKESTFRRPCLSDIVSEGTGHYAIQATVLQEC